MENHDIKQELIKRRLPEILKLNNGDIVKNKEQWKKRREEIKQILSEEEYGNFPTEHLKMEAELIEQDNNYCGGTVTLKKIVLTLKSNEDNFSIPIKIAVPKLNKPCPAFLYIDFYDDFPNKYLPVEEICDNGFAVISFYYKSVTTDDNDLSNGLSKFFYEDKTKRNYGKILVWSYAAMHIMDYIQEMDEIDKKNIAIVGHSRLGKTALLTGGFDERFKYTISNDSGQSGASISRNKTGERIKCIYERFPYWFCSNYSKYSEKEDIQPFDQHYLLSLIAPRNLYVASASKDIWADSESEFLCCTAVNDVYKLYNKNGIIHQERFPISGESFHKGYIGYHLREGQHYLSRYDWNKFIEYIRLNIDK